MTLEVQNLSYKYPNSTQDVFRNLTFQLPEPGFSALFGPSGVGKTTLAKIITAQIRPHSGRIKTDGLENCLYSHNLERLPGWSSVGKHLEKVTPPGRHQRRTELIDAFKVEECMGQRFAQLSVGQQNRVNLLRYLLQDFQLLIMDESLANVDELTRSSILFHIKEMFPDTYFLYISHNVVEVATYCKSIVVLRGAARAPQSYVVEGQDAASTTNIETGRLDRTMLEIVNASS